jgi:sugar phosphate isomerase/epimerase
VTRWHFHLSILMNHPLDHDWIYTFMGKGDLPLREIVRLLQDSGYEGCYSFEWETKWRKELQVEGAAPDEVFPQYTDLMSKLCHRQER